MNYKIKAQELKNEYSSRRRELAKRQDGLNIEKNDLLQREDETYHTTKRGLLATIVEIRKRKQALPIDDPQRNTMTDDIRNTETALSLAKDESDMRKREIIHDFYRKRAALDEECRQLTEQYEARSLALAAEYAAQCEADTEGGEQ